MRRSDKYWNRLFMRILKKRSDKFMQILGSLLYGNTRESSRGLERRKPYCAGGGGSVKKCLDITH